MRKRIAKAMRRLMVLLAAICILRNMPYMALTASSEETVSGNELILEQTKEENEDQAQASNSESGTEDGKETEDTNTEDSEESIMLLSAGDGISTVAVQQPYTDNNGVIYHYYGYVDDDNDRTANIYKLEDYSDPDSQGKEIIIPKEIEGYKITQLTFATEPDSFFSAVTIPETVTYIGGSVFQSATITQLYYNAVDATTDATNGSGGGVLHMAPSRNYTLVRM